MMERMLDIDLIPSRDFSSRRTIIVLHGLGDSKEGYRWLPDALQLPYLNYVLVDAPNEYILGYSWFSLDTDFGNPDSIADSRNLLFKLLDFLKKHDYPPEQMVLFGFSQGCLMSWEVGIRYPHVLAGVIGVSGWVSERSGVFDDISEISKQQRFLITHGINDSLIPIEKVREQVQRLKKKGLNIDYHEIQKDHTISMEEEIPLFRNFINKVLMEEPVNASVNNSIGKQA